MAVAAEKIAFITVSESRTTDGTPYVTCRGVYPFDAASTFTCGQCFRFDPVSAPYPEIFGGGAVYGGVAFGRYINVASPNDDTIVIEGVTAEDWRDSFAHYFGFDVDYASIIKKVGEIYGRESRIAEAARAGYGIRILAQEPWEALCSFIISQNNNIPRIKGIIDRLCRLYGAPLEWRGETKYAFPTPQALADAGVEGIAPTRMGFRARYVADAAAAVASGDGYLEAIASAQYERADAMLRELRGVGPKVASCVLLFGFGRYEAFPVDVWIRRTIGRYFDAPPEKLDFGELAPYAGILQQYIFNYERNHVGE